MCFFVVCIGGHIHGTLRYMFQGMIAQVYTGILKEKGNDIDKKPLQVTWFTRDQSHNLFVTIRWFKSGDWKNCNRFIWLSLSHRFATCYSIISPLFKKVCNTFDISYIFYTIFHIFAFHLLHTTPTATISSHLIHHKQTIWAT